MAQIRPARKERKRYVVYTPRNDQEVLSAHQILFGVVGAAKAGLIPVEGTHTTGIIRVAHTHVDQLKATLVHTQKHSLLTTGTLKTARHTLRN